MIKHHPEEVISTSASSDDEEAASAKRGSLDSLEARCVHNVHLSSTKSRASWVWLTVPTTHNRLLRVAAHLALASAVALIEALDGLEKGSPGYVHLCRYNIGASLLLMQMQIHREPVTF